MVIFRHGIRGWKLRTEEAERFKESPIEIECDGGGGGYTEKVVRRREKGADESKNSYAPSPLTLKRFQPQVKSQLDKHELVHTLRVLGR